MSNEHLKAVCIIGSPREDGATALLVNLMIEGMQAAGIATDRRILSRLNINYCQGCRDCEESLRCVQRDDMDGLLRDIFAADIVVLASPSYWGDVTWQMKVFIDRCLPVCNAKTGATPVPKRKIGIGVAVRAGHSIDENERLLGTFCHYLWHLGVEMAAHLTVEGVNEPSDLDQQTEKLVEAYLLGRTVIQKLNGTE